MRKSGLVPNTLWKCKNDPQHHLPRTQFRQDSSCRLFLRGCFTFDSVFGFLVPPSMLNACDVFKIVETGKRGLPHLPLPFIFADVVRLVWVRLVWL